MQSDHQPLLPDLDKQEIYLNDHSRFQNYSDVGAPLNSHTPLRCILHTSLFLTTPHKLYLQFPNLNPSLCDNGRFYICRWKLQFLVPAGNIHYFHHYSNTPKRNLSFAPNHCEHRKDMSCCSNLNCKQNLGFVS